MRLFSLSLAILLVSIIVCDSVRAQLHLADVLVNSPMGEFRPFENGEQVFAPYGVGHWEGIPSVLEKSDLSFWHITTTGGWPDVSWGITQFQVQTEGPVWMITTTRFGGGGNSDGDWLPEVTSRAELEQDGWKEIASGLGDTGPDHSYLIFERYSLAGESFTLRTEKYVPPILLVGSVVPEPSSVALANLLIGVLFAGRFMRRVY